MAEDTHNSVCQYRAPIYRCMCVYINLYVFACMCPALYTGVWEAACHVQDDITQVSGARATPTSVPTSHPGHISLLPHLPAP
ncbi:hypothetical protein FKM82_008212 [Ascaphus truei]